MMRKTIAAIVAGTTLTLGAAVMAAPASAASYDTEVFADCMSSYAAKKDAGKISRVTQKMEDKCLAKASKNYDALNHAIGVNSMGQTVFEKTPGKAYDTAALSLAEKLWLYTSPDHSGLLGKNDPDIPLLEATVTQNAEARRTADEIYAQYYDAARAQSVADDTAEYLINTWNGYTTTLDMSNPSHVQFLSEEEDRWVFTLQSSSYVMDYAAQHGAVPVAPSTLEPLVPVFILDLGSSVS